MFNKQTFSVGLFMAAIICALLHVPHSVVGFLVVSSYAVLWTAVMYAERLNQNDYLHSRMDDVMDEIDRRCTKSK